MIQRASFALFESKRSTGKVFVNLTDDHIKTVFPLIGEQNKDILAFIKKLVIPVMLYIGSKLDPLL